MTSTTQRAQGCLLGTMIGDALGAGIEGFSRGEIESIAKAHGWSDGLIHDFILAVHMATYVQMPNGSFHGVVEERERELEGGRRLHYIEHGPIDGGEEDPLSPCGRKGMYTDDANSCLALASSLAELGKLDAKHAARRYAEFWQTSQPPRGYPATAKAVMSLVLEGTVPISQTGLPPHFPFKGGSFANGGAMRIAPLAIAYRNASPEQLKAAVRAAIRSSHAHPEAVDGAVAQAMLVQYALGQTVEGFDSKTVLSSILETCDTNAMKFALSELIEQLGNLELEPAPTDENILDAILKRIRRPGSGRSFQIAAVHAVPCVLWIACRYIRTPKLAVMRAVALGGDTDTIASMVAATVGALHGIEMWSAEPDDWFTELENGDRGRDYAMNLAERLGRLDLRKTSKTIPEEKKRQVQCGIM